MQAGQTKEIYSACMKEEGSRWANSLVPDEAADGNPSPAHAAHEAAGHEATGE